MKKLFLLAMLLLPAALSAQVPVTLSPVPRPQFFFANGNPLSGGCVYTYSAGTSTPAPTYADSGGVVQNPNPIVLDGGGFAPTGIWIAAQAYKFVVFSSGGVNCATGSMQWTIDNISPGTFSAGNNTFTGNNTFSGTTTFTGALNATAGGTLSGSFGGNPNFTGTPTFSGVFQMPGGFVSGANSTFQGQIISTVPNGTPPMVVTSTSNIPNLDASLLQNQTYSPAPPLYSVPLTTTSPTVPTSIGGATIVTRGTGFNIGDLLSVTGGGGSGAILEVTGVTAGPPGPIANVTILSGGSGYANTSPASLSVLTGSGTGSPTANISVTGTTSAGATTPSIITDCPDTGGQHLNFSQASTFFICGVSSPVSAYKIEAMVTTPVTDTNTVTPTPLQSFTLPASELVAGQDLRLTGRGTYTAVASAAGVCTLQVLMDGAVLGTANITPVLNRGGVGIGTPAVWTYSYDLMVITQGAGGNAEADGSLLDPTDGGTTYVEGSGNTSTISFNTTVSHTFAIEATWAGANPSSITQRQWIAERLGP